MPTVPTFPMAFYNLLLRDFLPFVQLLAASKVHYRVCFTFLPLCRLYQLHPRQLQILSIHLTRNVSTATKPYTR